LKYFPWAAMHLQPNDAATVGNIFETSIVEQLSVTSHFIFGCFQYPEILVPLRHTLFLETARSHLELNQRNTAGVSFQ
jgi:hypothetical protein